MLFRSLMRACVSKIWGIGFQYGSSVLRGQVAKLKPGRGSGWLLRFFLLTPLVVQPQCRKNFITLCLSTYLSAFHMKFILWGFRLVWAFLLLLGGGVGFFHSSVLC